MCRNIKSLFNFEPPATVQDVHDAALQFVRKISGFSKPSKVNEEVFQEAVKEIAETTERLLRRLVTSAPIRNRETELAQKRTRWARRNIQVTNPQSGR